MKDRKEYFKEYYKRNRAERIKRAKEWNENNPEKLREYIDNYTEQNREIINKKRMERYYRKKGIKNNEKK